MTGPAFLCHGRQDLIGVHPGRSGSTFRLTATGGWSPGPLARWSESVAPAGESSFVGRVIEQAEGSVGWEQDPASGSSAEDRPEGPRPGGFACFGTFDPVLSSFPG